MRWWIALASGVLWLIAATANASAEGAAVDATTPSLAADLEERIDTLVASGRSEEAIPLARKLAEQRPDRIAHWERLRTFAGWNSDAEAELDALIELVRLSPEDRDLRLALAQRLLWAQRPREGVVHAHWLLSRPDENDPLALEVATWTLMETGHKDEAKQAILRWIAAAPDASQPRWILADLTHWSVDWREARAQYDELEGDEEYGAKAAERERLLRKDHPTKIEGTAVYWMDTTDVEYWSVGSRAQLQLPARFILSPSVEYGRWQQDAEFASGELDFVRGLLGLRYELSEQVQPELVGGIEEDSRDHYAPVIIGRAHYSLLGKVFGRLEGGWDRYRISLGSATEDVRMVYGRLLTYAEPVEWLFFGVDGSITHLDDGNNRYYSVLAVGVHNTNDFQVEPRAFLQVEAWQEHQDDAYPYYTTEDPVAVGGDLTLRYTNKDIWLRAEAAGGVVNQGGEWAFVPRAAIAVDLAEHLIGKVSAGYIGAVEYRQLRTDLSLGYRF